MSDSPRLPLVRLLLVGMLVPAVFSAVDHWLLSQMQYEPTRRHIGLTLAAFVLQVGLLGWLCGRFLENPWWRWGLYLWGWVLVDLQLLSAGVFADSGRWWYRAEMLPSSLFAAQVGLTIVWGVLGTTRWAVRLPACLVLGTLLAIPLGRNYSYGLGDEMYGVQMVTLAALCLLLRWRGYKLQQVAAPPAGRSPSAAGAQLGQMQFGIRNVLVWTTSLAVVLGVLRALDLLSLRALAPFMSQDYLSLATAGLLTACVFVVAVWAGLGSGPVWLRVPVLLFVMPPVGAVLAFLEWNYQRIMFRSSSSIDVLWTTNWALPQLWEEHSWLVLWLTLAGSLLYASLMILRVRGYRLVREGAPRPAAQNRLTGG
jgi:hypothetical protein